ncbi:MAG: BTAD domain-containing putative transcriptional regulator, partial [Solirubrobacteraceae bacterium]
MHVGILGPLQVEHDGRPIEVGGGRLRALVACLALEAGRPVRADRLVEAVWDHGDQADAAHSLQSLVSRLRRALGGAELVPAAPGGYRLAVEPDAVDAARFERLADDGGAALARGDHAAAADLLAEALALWRGPALADVPDSTIAQAAAAALEARRLTALADRIEADLALGAGARVIAELESLTADHPLDERFSAQLMTALYAGGRQADALAVYERVRRALDAELGVAPSPVLQAAHLSVLHGAAAPAPDPETPHRRSNLRAPLTSFVGREEELARIEALLADGVPTDARPARGDGAAVRPEAGPRGVARLVTLVGPGGAGKTRLAGEAAGRRVDDVADGVWMVELAPLTDPVEIVPAVIASLGLRDTALVDRPGHRAPRDGLDRVLDVLRDREAIVVLDNCEHLVTPAAELAETLLGACPRLRILATSREPLGITGESLVPVPPLPLPRPDAGAGDALADPAVRLFADRAAAVQPGFAVDDGTVEPVVEICRRLDGLPLAIELAAARLRSMPVAEIARRLDDRFRLLTGGSRTALPRHRTLRAVVDWSWELLGEPERRLARRLAVFAAGATTESAAAVCAGAGIEPDDVPDGLAALVERSLLQVEPGSEPPRYRMLETIREYGLEQLAAAGEIEAVRGAHARWFADLAAAAEPRLRGPEQRQWYRRLDHERDNVLAALRWLGD